MKINKKKESPRNKKSAREADRIMDASLIKCTGPGVAQDKIESQPTPQSANWSVPCPSYTPFMEEKRQMAINIGSDVYPH